MATKSGGIDRVVAKCRACVEGGNFYEAHQMYRTLYFRYKGQKKYTEALNLLYNGSLTLLQHNQHSSGADLAMLMIELLNTSLTPVTDDTIDKVVKLFRAMNPDCPERHHYMVSSIRWSTKTDNQRHKLGHPDLHQRIGRLFWEEKNYVQARYHFLHSTDGKGCATMLIEYHLMKGYTSEVDMFIAQAVLQYLCLQNKETANDAFQTYTQNHPQVRRGSPYVHPLLNFIWFLLLALEGGHLTVFTILCEKYETSIKRDPTYKEYLDKIGQVFFGVPPPRAPSQGLFGNLIQSLFSGGEDDEDMMQVSSSSWGSMGSSMTTSTREINQVELD
ncbi:Golgi to ER traffic protein 4 homolog [Ylistrum balloti]|uniref:Golgi to ER traffic protein 4 homolog n=1 Tax=Ylistrum balloti TaxID=509963 RepID=UPI0029057EA6|nr:Golgi to ER traffic protein 4 homolog [Ylistrum balloti]